jgi:hypothetical protein
MTEYLVELMPGREVAYRSVLALRAAMRSGEITPEARIYHRAASRWIPISMHPEYRRFLAERRPPNWLEPIPFEPASPEPAAEPRGLAGVLHRVARWLRGAAGRARPAPHAPPGAERESAPPADKRWTYY